MSFINTRKLLLVVSTIIISMTLIDIPFAATYDEIISEHRKTVVGILGDGYDKFLNKIGKEEYDDINVGFIHMKTSNDILIVGSSGVVHLGHNMQSDYLDKYNADVIGLGGISDRMMLEFIPYIKKKYKKIIILNGVNTVNSCLTENVDNVKYDLVNDIKNVCEQYKKLLKSNGKLVFLNMEPYHYSVDDYTIAYNYFVSVITPLLYENGIPVVRFDYQVDKGLHSMKRGMFENLMRECG